MDKEVGSAVIRCDETASVLVVEPADNAALNTADGLFHSVQRSTLSQIGTAPTRSRAWCLRPWS